MYLLDSDTLSHLWTSHERVVQRLPLDTTVHITVITKCEVLRVRCENLLKAATDTEIVRAQERLDHTERLLGTLIVVPFDQAAAREFQHLSKIGKLKNIGRADMLIASIAIARDATLVTRNLRHFRQVPKLVVENWVDA